MKVRHKLLAASAAFIAFMSAPSAGPRPVYDPGHTVIRILRVTKDGHAIAESMVAPAFEFRVEQGQVNEHDVLELDQKREMRQAGNMRYPTVVLQRGDIKLALLSVDLTVKR